MKRYVLLVVIFSLVVSLIAPAGAVFAIMEEVEAAVSDEGDVSEYNDSSEYEENAVVIAQIQVGISGNARDEYIAIYNNSDDTVDVTGWCVQNKNGVKFACLDQPDIDYDMLPGSYIGLSSTSERMSSAMMVIFAPGSAPSGHIVAGNDKIWLVAQGGEKVDSLEWSSQPSGKYGIERLWSTSQFGKLRTDEGSWAWKSSLGSYGYIDELVECADGSIVEDASYCVAEKPDEQLCRNDMGVDIVVLSEWYGVDSEGNCQGVAGHNELRVTEVLPNPKGDDKGGEFIELYNYGEQPVNLTYWLFHLNEDYAKAYSFPVGVVVQPGEYYVLKNTDVNFTLTNSTGSVRVRTIFGINSMDVPEWANAKVDQAWALIDGEWQYTSVPTPGRANEPSPSDDELAKVLADCGEGRERNPATGRCRNIPVAKELAPCKEGQYRSEETNRCRSIASAVSSLKPCADDQFRNPETNRCKKIASAEELADCGEGRERNPTTNRCRNVLTAAMPTASFAPEGVKHVAGSTLGWWAFGGVSLVAVGYAGWQWRFEMRRLVRNIGSTFSIRSK